MQIPSASRLSPSVIGTGQENVLKRLWLGAGIGLILWILAVIIAGYGHGILAFALLSSAPLPLFTSPLLWALLAYLTRWRVRWVFPVTEALHFLGAAIYVCTRGLKTSGTPTETSMRWPISSLTSSPSPSFISVTTLQAESQQA
jgi:hypothetical protein